MMTDKLLRFCENKTLTDGMQSDILDLGPPDAGMGRNMDLYVILEGAPAAALDVDIETSDADDMTGAVVVATYPIDADDVQAGGKVIRNRIPSGLLRYARLVFNGVAGGAVSAGLVKDS